jgi:hypothetical protein
MPDHTDPPTGGDILAELLDLMTGLGVSCSRSASWRSPA